MKFKIVENYDQTREFIQEYAYEVIDELGNSSLEEYIQWFMSEFTYFDDEVKQAVKDFYIEAIDCGKIDLPKTMITSELTTYLESNVDLIDKDVDELIRNCPDHLKHELKIVLSKLDESLTEASNSVTKAFSDKIISGHTSNVRGSDIVSDAIIDRYNMRKLSNNQHYVIHHRDGNHKNTAQGNEFIMSNTDHGRIHKLVRNRIQSEYFDRLEDQKILDYIAHLKQVETFVKKLKSVSIGASIDDNKIIFEAPLLDDTDAVKRYNELIKLDNDAIKKINCEVFDDFFAEYQFLGKGKKNVRIAEYTRTQESLVNNN